MWFNQQSTMSNGCWLLVAHPSRVKCAISHLIIVIKERTVHNGENGAHTELWRGVHLFSPFRTHFTQRSNYRQLLIDLLCWVRRSFTKLPPTLVLLFLLTLLHSCWNSTQFELRIERTMERRKRQQMFSHQQQSLFLYPLFHRSLLISIFIRLQPSAFIVRWMWPPSETDRPLLLLLSVWVTSRFNFISPHQPLKAKDITKLFSTNTFRASYYISVCGDGNSINVPPTLRFTAVIRCLLNASFVIYLHVLFLWKLLCISPPFRHKLCLLANSKCNANRSSVSVSCPFVDC